MSMNLTNEEFLTLAYYFRGEQTARKIAATVKNEEDYEKVYYDKGLSLIKIIRSIADKCNNNEKNILIYIGEEALVKLAENFLTEKFTYTQLEKIKMILLLQNKQDSLLIIGDMVDENNVLFFNKEYISSLPTMKNLVLDNAKEILDAKEKEIYQNLFLEIDDNARIYKIEPNVFEKNYQQKFANILQEAMFIVKDALISLINEHIICFKQGLSDQQVFEYFRDKEDDFEVEHDLDVLELEKTDNKRARPKIG